MIFSGLFRIYRRISARRALGFGLILGLLTISLIGNALCYYLFDRPTKPDLTIGDALWYSIISMTTIGYGDHFAESTGARVGTVIFIVVIGLSTFTVFLGMLIDSLTDSILRGQRGMRTAMASNHILIVNFPSESRTVQLIEEIRSDPHRKNVEIVVVTDQISRLPFSYENVQFVHGSPLQAETYERARMRDAKMVIVLSPSYSDPNSDAVVASAVSVIDSIQSEARIVAECLDEKHRMLFKSVHCDAIVFGLKITGNLLVQELNDPGVVQMINVITSNLEGTTLYSARVEAARPERTYGQMAKSLTDHDVSLISVNRGAESITAYRSLQPEVGDAVIYIADRRSTWQELLTMTAT
jgi:voltage-gated potassium channel